MLIFSAVCVTAVSWALFEYFRNPAVEFAAPQTIERNRDATGPVTLVFGGDFAPADAATPWIERRGFRYPFEATAELLQQADVAFANLEAPISSREAPAHLFAKYHYRVDPSAVPALSWAGFDVISIANNHVLDHGPEALLDTLRALDAAGIAHVGAGSNESTARRPVIVNVRGIKVGFIAYLENQPMFNLYARMFAVGDRIGCAQLNRADTAEDIRRLRALVDVLLVSAHWGKNYEPITAAQESYAGWLLDSGADVVAGHHPHIEQAVERRGEKLIFYSLGNYAWGAPGRRMLKLGLLARLRIDRTAAGRARIADAELVPLVTQNRIVQYQPRRLRANETEWLQPLLDESRKRGTALRVQAEPDGIVLRIEH